MTKYLCASEKYNIRVYLCFGAMGGQVVIQEYRPEINMSEMTGVTFEMAAEKNYWREVEIIEKEIERGGICYGDKSRWKSFNR